jgi:hypothetical protein
LKIECRSLFTLATAIPPPFFPTTTCLSAMSMPSADDDKWSTWLRSITTFGASSGLMW